MSRSRVPAGVPTGGQFSSPRRSEADVDLSSGAGRRCPLPSIEDISRELNKASLRLYGNNTDEGRAHVQAVTAYGAARLVEHDYPGARTLDLGVSGPYDQMVAVGVRDGHGRAMAELTDEQKAALFRFTSALRQDDELVCDNDTDHGPAWFRMDLPQALRKGDTW